MEEPATESNTTSGYADTASAEIVEQIESLNKQAWSIKKGDTTRAFGLAMQARQLAEANSYERGIAYGLRNSGYCHYQLGNYKTALADALNGKAVFEKLEDRHGLASTLNTLGCIYHSLGEYSKSVESCSQSLQISTQIADRFEEARALNTIGNTYLSLGDHAKALQHFLQSLKIKTEINMLEGLPRTLSNIGAIHEQLGEYETAADYYLTAMQKGREIGDTETESVCLGNLGMVYGLMGDYAIALDHLLKAADVCQKNGNKYPEGGVFIYLGRLYQKMGEHEKALCSYRKGLEIVQQIGHKVMEVEAFIGLGELFYEQEEYSQAVESFSGALCIAEEIGNSEHMFKSHLALSQAYERKGDFVEALNHHKAFYTFRQKVFGEEADKNLKRVMIQAEVEKAQKEAEIHRLKHVELASRVRELEELTNELKRSQDKILQLEKQATEQQMAGGFAHEMRNALAGSKLILDQALALDGPEPHISLSLANCRGLKEMYLGLKGKLPEGDTLVLLGQMQTIFANEERLDEVMQLVRKATSRGLNITQQIMDYSKMGQQQPGQQSVDLNSLIAGIVNESQEEFSSQGVVIEFKSEHELLIVSGDETHFYSIFKNILMNARDALLDPSLTDRKDRKIAISTALAGGTCSAVIADNGIGITAENLQKVFEPFFSTKPSTGTGLGLGMVKKMVSLYNGKIEVSSEAGKGTTVTITLPTSPQRETV